MAQNKYTFSIGRINVPVVEYHKKELEIKETTEKRDNKAGEVRYSANIGSELKINDILFFPCKLTVNARFIGIEAKITTESKIGINGISEISDEEKKEVNPDLLRPLVSKAAEVFAYLTGNDNPFPIILNGDLGHNVINLTTKKE